MEALLRANRLTKHYGPVVALESAEFEVVEGVTGLLGSNGAGKSTAIKLFLGLIAPTSGSMQVLGVESSADVGLRSRLGYMPEHDCLPGNVSAAEFLTHMAQVSGLPPSYARSLRRRHTASRGSVRGTLPPYWWLLDGHEAASEACAGTRPRPRSDPS